jgi:hypothetical protein
MTAANRQPESILIFLGPPCRRPRSLWVLGKAFENVVTPTEIKQAIAAAGTPTPPDGTCATSR